MAKRTRPNRTPNQNRIVRLGSTPHRDITKVPNELARNGVSEMGPDAVVVMLLLLSHSDGWELSAVEIGRQFEWGRNGQRVANALKALASDRRLVIREVQRDGGGVVRRDYVFHSDARRMTDEEIEKHSIPLYVSGPTLPGKRGGSNV